MIDDLGSPADDLIEGGSGEGALAAFAAPAVIPSPRQPPHVEKLLRWSDPLQTINICDEILAEPGGAGILSDLGQKVCTEYEIDERSRSEWLDRTRAAMKLAMQVADTKKVEPWEGASNIIYPLIATAAIQFAARAYPAIVPGPMIVKGMPVGDDRGMPLLHPETGEPLPDPKGNGVAWAVRPGAKQARATRISEHMSWQYLEEQEEWEPETDRLVHILPIVGCCFRKTLFDREEDRNSGLLVLAENLVINYRAKSLKTAPRVTEQVKLYPFEIEEAVRSGTFREHEYGTDFTSDGDRDALRDYLEQHRRYDLDGDGYAEPYIVTVHKPTQKVVRIVARYDAEGIKLSGVDKKVRRIEPVHYYDQYDFLPNPDGGIYGVGFGQFLNPINEAINSSLNQIFDAGTLQNSNSGFIGRGLSLHSGSFKLKMGRYHVVNALGSTVRDAIVPLKFDGPSPVLFQLLGLLIEAGKELSSNTEVLSGTQRQANVPATTTLALIEQGLKVFTGVYKRIYRSLKSEFRKQFRLNRIYLDKSTGYRFNDEWRVIEQKDYIEGGAVIPAADPSMVSDMQQLARAEALMQFKDDPLFDRIEVRRRILAAMKVEDIEKLLVTQAPPDPSVQVKAMEIALRAIEIKAKAVANMAMAIEHLAKADTMVDENFRAWVALQLEGLRPEIEGLSHDATGGEEPVADRGTPGAGVPGLAAAPGQPPIPAMAG